MNLRSDRFQCQPWYVKLYRFRYYLLIPFHALRFWWGVDDKKEYPFRICWSICKGSVQWKMTWYYTMDEVKRMTYDSFKFTADDASGDGCVRKIGKVKWKIR